MSGDNRAGDRVAPEQLAYARALDVGMKIGLAVLAASFLIYIAGMLPTHLPFEDLTRLWALPVGEFLEESGMEPGWGWLALLAKGDMLALGGVVLLTGVSLPCLALLLPGYARRRDWTYLAITACLIVVLVLAATGAVVPH